MDVLLIETIDVVEVDGYHTISSSALLIITVAFN